MPHDSTPSWPDLAPEQRSKEARRYFAEKAEDYDDVDNQPYWVFSDTLLWDLLRTLVIEDLVAAQPDFHLIDAGCGTARWSARILEYAPAATATLLDISPEMLSVARRKLTGRGLASRATIREIDLQMMASDDIQAADLLICFHNVVSFVADPVGLVNRLMRMVRVGGTLVIVAPNVYHAAFFSFAHGRHEQVEAVYRRGTVAFTDTTPEMCLFTPDLLREVLAEAGSANLRVLGFPVTIYPQAEETTLRESSALARRSLSTPAQRERLIMIEREYCLRPETAARGNNLLAIARRA